MGFKKTEKEFLLELWSQNICPACRKTIPKGKRIGSGQKSKGGFCSLECYADYYKTELSEKAKDLLNNN